ncbi:hypothetical protein ACMX2H_16115 [Arthrobacter sulfonylureivorans]|uniref:hypothetical protein n=1 Tax=Arthrobacter sulfonylureivorans TaxID=2486855 RepID=UPI0039E37D2A
MSEQKAPPYSHQVEALMRQAEQADTPEQAMYFVARAQVCAQMVAAQELWRVQSMLGRMVEMLGGRNVEIHLGGQPVEPNKEQ